MYLIWRKNSNSPWYGRKLNTLREPNEYACAGLQTTLRSMQLTWVEWFGKAEALERGEPMRESQGQFRRDQILPLGPHRETLHGRLGEGTPSELMSHPGHEVTMAVLFRGEKGEKGPQEESEENLQTPIAWLLEMSFSYTCHCPGWVQQVAPTALEVKFSGTCLWVHRNMLRNLSMA